MTRKARRAAGRVELVPRRLANEAAAQQVAGVLAAGRGDLQAAREHFAHATIIEPHNAEAHGNLAESLRQLGRDEAIPAFQRALALDGNRAATWTQYGQALAAEGRYGEAIQAAHDALKLDPAALPALHALGFAQWASGHVDEGIVTMRRAIALAPADGPSWSNLLMFLQYSEAHSEEELFQAAQAWGLTMEPPRLGSPASAMAEPVRLRVGYVSGDFVDHPAGHQIEKILAGHDAARIEVFLYGTSVTEDTTTLRLKELAQGWRNLSKLDDAEAARRIAADGIHVLIDLSGHTAGHRLGIFAHRPAPVQASWLGYFATTGLPQMDFILRDPAQIPLDEARFYAERVWTLQGAAFGYQPHAECPDVSPLPAHANGFVTFGCFANPAKISEETIAAWARVLHRVPGSRMLLDRKGLDDPVGRDRILALFARHGIGPERLDLSASRGHLAYLARYAEVDVVLDTFPFNGGTTTYEAVWMGLPVVSRRGKRMVGHFAESILGPCGHADWIADDEDGYVETAVALASDHHVLADLRMNLRGELAASPLCQGGDCARALESAFEGMWRTVRVAGGPISSEVVGTYQIQAIDAYRRGDADLAERMFRRITELCPDLADGHNNLGVALRQGKRIGEAIGCFERALALRPDDAAAHRNLGGLLTCYGRNAEALAHLRRAIELEPGGAQTTLDMVAPLALLGRFEEAFAAFERGAILDPEAAAAQEILLYDRLGDAFATHSRFEEAVACFTEAQRRVLERASANRLLARALHAVGTSLQHAGRADEAVDWFARALQADPNDPEAHGSLAWCYQYTDRYDEDQASAWARAQARRYAPAHGPRSRRDRSGPLRVGYLSPDFRNHAVGHVMETLLKTHRRDEFEIFLYASVAEPDEVTQRLARLVGRWRDIVSLGDEAAADLVRRDEIDVLVDLAGYTKGHRMGVFAGRPAPVQAQWLGYWATSGLSQMDYFIVHPSLIPPEEERLYTERPMRVEGRAFCYAPPERDIPVPPLPALERGFVTFGCHNYLGKVTSETIRVWAEVLKAVPGSRMRLNRHAFGSQATRESFLSRFEAYGIARSRVDLLTTYTSDEHLVALGEFDVMLDTFPFNGGTSTYEALWMGLPVVTMAAPRMVGHFGENILEPLGFGDWVARSTEEYVAQAVALASDLAALAHRREGLRGRLLASPLCDAPAYTREIEDAFRRMVEETERSTSAA